MISTSLMANGYGETKWKQPSKIFKLEADFQCLYRMIEMVIVLTWKFRAKGCERQMLHRCQGELKETKSGCGLKISIISVLREQQFGVLEVFSYLATVMAILGAMAYGWDVNLVVLLIMLALVYAVLRALAALWVLKEGTSTKPTTPADQFSAPPQSLRASLSSSTRGIGADTRPLLSLSEYHGYLGERKKL